MMRRSLILAVLSTLGVAAHAQSLDTPPSTPGNPVVNVYSPTFAVVQWQRSTDDRGAVAGYTVRRDGVDLGTFDALSYVDRDLLPGRGYNYVIRAVDNAGQRSPRATVRAVTPDAVPSPPSGIRADIYSRTAAELFWDRSPVFGERYEIKRDGVVVTTTDGTSHYDNTLRASRPYLFEVIALNRENRRSAPVRLFVDTSGRGGPTEPTPAGPAAPSGLRAAVYSGTAAEVFWERPTTFGLSYEVRRNGEVLATTDGTSWFDDALSGGTSYTYTVVAINRDGRRSAGSEVTLTTLGAGGAVLGVDNADAVLKEVASIANADFFPQFLPIVNEEFGEMFALWIPDSTASSNSYALIEGSPDEPFEGPSGRNGGRYTCLAGGSVALPTILGGEASDAFVVRFDRCVTVSDTLGAAVTLDGEASVFPGGPGSSGGFRSTGYTNLTVRSDALELAIDGSVTSTVGGRGGTSTGDVETTVSRYTRTVPDGESATVSDYRSLLSVSVGGAGGVPRTASAEIGFVASTPGTAGQTLDVDIDLDYDGSDTPPEGRVDQWDSGRIVVEAADGSRLRAEPIADDPATLRIIVGDVTLERPWAEGYQIDCVGNLSGCR